MYNEEEENKQLTNTNEETTPKRVEMAFEVLQHLNSTETRSIFCEGRELSKQEERVRVLALRVIGQYIAGELEFEETVRPIAQPACGVDPRSGGGKLDAFGDRQSGQG